MGQSASTDQVSLLLAGYVLGTLDAAEAEMFAQMVVEDPALVEQIDQMQQALEDAYDMPELAPPTQLKEKVLAAVVAPESSILSEPATSRPAYLATSVHQHPSRQLKAIAIALFAALGLSALFNVILWRQNQQIVASSPDLLQPEQALSPRVYRLLPTEAAMPEEIASVTIDQNTLTAELIASQLPPLPPDETYALWTVLKPEAPYTTDEKDAILTATFRVSPKGTIQEAIALPTVYQQPELIKAIAITIESTAAPQDHTGSPRLFAKISLSSCIEKAVENS